MPYVAELINHIRGRIYESAYLAEFDLAQGKRSRKLA